MSEAIKFICKRTIVSTEPVQPNKQYELSGVDHLMEKNQVRLVYYYGSTLKKKESYSSQATRKLMESLSEMLTRFDIATGRLINKSGSMHDITRRWTVKCNDAGVRMVEARVKGSVEEWLETVDREKELQLIHWEDVYHKPYFWSTFYVQVTEFEGGGLAIGLSCTHLLADPISASMFIRAWADMALAKTITFPPSFHPLPRPNSAPNHKPYNHLIDYYKSFIAKTLYAPASSNYKTVTFLFTGPMVKACMSKVRPIGPGSDIDIVSPFTVLSALFWICASKAKKQDGMGLIDMSICLDMRSVLGLDKGYFRNCMVYSKVKSLNSPNSCGTQITALSHAAISIEEEMVKMDKEKITNLIEWVESNDNYSCFMNDSDLICTNLENMEFYSAIFEDMCPPVRVSCYVEPVKSGKILVLPSPVGEGPLSRVVMVTLPEKEMRMVCDDFLIRNLSPILLMKLSNE